MNEYLNPPASPDEQAELLTRAGFPLEDREPVEGTDDVRLDYEMTSNRGDCVCHLGLAREIAAISGRGLKAPLARPKASGPAAEKQVTVTNREPAACPLYTARIIRGVKVGPSPEWLARRLEAINQIPRNNIVDASNFVLFELGQPTHVFDLATLAGPEIIIRMAEADEPFLPIGEGAQQVRLSPEDLVIADRDRAVAIAGVKGGAKTAVSGATTDLLLEAATFDPVLVRRTGRRRGIESDSAFRFERGVHPQQIEAAADRLAAIILEVAGGTLAPGVVADGAPLPPPREVAMRVNRCCDLLGVDVPAKKMVDWLERLQFRPKLADKGAVIRCTVPCYRLDVEREIDVIEEVGRMLGHDKIPIAEKIEIQVAEAQASERARAAVCTELVGMGFVECVTHSIIGMAEAKPFLPQGTEPLVVAGEDAVLRPSVLPSLLRVRTHNRDNGVRSLKLFEQAATFHRAGQTHDEEQRLALTIDLERSDDGLRPLRGVIDRLAELLLGPDQRVAIVADETPSWLSPAARVEAGGRTLGWLGIVTPAVQQTFQLDGPVAAAELTLPALYEQFPPEREAHTLPSYPAVERDVSAIVDDRLEWARLSGVVNELDLEHLEAVEFVASYRGKQIGAGKKSLTLRLRFRAPDRTLTHGSVDTQMESVLAALTTKLQALIRT